MNKKDFQDCFGLYYDANDKWCKRCIDAPKCAQATYRKIGEAKNFILTMDEASEFVAKRMPNDADLKTKKEYLVFSYEDREIWIGERKKILSVYFKNRPGSWNDLTSGYKKTSDDYTYMPLRYKEFGDYVKFMEIVERYLKQESSK